MHIYRSGGPLREEAASRMESSARGLVPGRVSLTGEGAVTVRCPRCQGELIVMLRRGVPGFFCHCPVRRVKAA